MKRTQLKEARSKKISMMEGRGRREGEEVCGEKQAEE